MSQRKFASAFEFGQAVAMNLSKRAQDDFDNELSEPGQRALLAQRTNAIKRPTMVQLPPNPGVDVPQLTHSRRRPLGRVTPQVSKPLPVMSANQPPRDPAADYAEHLRANGIDPKTWNNPFIPTAPTSQTPVEQLGKPERSNFPPAAK